MGKGLTPPFVVGRDVDGLKVLIPRRINTILTSLGGIRIQQIPTRLLRKSTRILKTRLIRRRIKHSRLLRSTLHLLSIQRRGQHTANPVRRRIHPVHPRLPKDLHLRVGSDNTVEAAKLHEKEGQDVGDDGVGWGKSAYPLAPARHVDVHQHRHEV